MSIKSQRILITTAVVLLVFALAAGAFLLFGGAKNGQDTKTGSQYVHPPVEKFYNDDGTLNREVYYDRDEYMGQTDYFSEGAMDYVMYYDKDGNMTKSEVYEKYAGDKILSHKVTENGKVVLLEEYTYDINTELLTKYTKKAYDENGKEFAEKLYYAEDGETVTEKVTFEDGEEISRETYDENNPYKEN